MTAMTMKYASPSTPSIQHDLTNFIVEAILINRYGALPEACWRKGRPFATVWGEILKKVRSVKRLGITLEQLAWYVQFHKIIDLDFAEFGLLKWKIDKYFKWCNVDKFVAHYTALHSSLVGESSSYVEDTAGYQMKDPNSGCKKTLSDIIKELENECGSDDGRE
jgi:hypothetical protein